jgi:hypothetical protein
MKSKTAHQVSRPGCASTPALTKPEEATKALWAKCSACGHCWPAMYYPIDMAAMGRILKHIVCPKGCDSKAMVAKQSDGVLQEPA